jgi:hypothetical protein
MGRRDTLFFTIPVDNSVALTFQNILTSNYCMESSSPWETISCSATQKFPNILWHPKTHRRARKSLPLAPILSQINLVHTAPSYSCKMYINIIFLLRSMRSRDSAVGIATGYWLDDRKFGVRVLVGSGIFSSTPSPDWLLGPTQPPNLWVPGALSPGVKRPRRQADHSPPTSAEVKKTWIYTCTSPYVFMA